MNTVVNKGLHGKTFFRLLIERRRQQPLNAAMSTERKCPFLHDSSSKLSTSEVSIIDHTPPEPPTITPSQDPQLVNTSRTSELGTSDVVLVTGGAGFLGQHIVRLLQTKAPHVTEIRILDLQPYIPWLDQTNEKPVVSYRGCLMDPGILERAMQGVSSVYHIAGKISYGTFPDYGGMTMINTVGTANIIHACQKSNVSRLIYCSTVDVAIGHQPIIDGNEANTAPPGHFLFPGYPESKYRAECLVIGANGTNTHNGNKLHTISLRANVMYGEGDPYYVTNGLRNAKRTGGVLYQIGNGSALFQPVYVGNTAWAFICADKTLKQTPERGGNFFYIPDDTPTQNTFQFMKPFLEVQGLKLSNFKLPFLPIYYSFKCLELFAFIISPVYKIRLPTESYTIKYLNMDLYFSRNKAEKELSYFPIFTPRISIERSLPYYRDLQL